MSICLYVPNKISFRFKDFFYFLNFINRQIKIHNTENLKCRITTLSGSNFILFTKKIYSKTEMFKNRNIKKVIQMTPMTKN